MLIENSRFYIFAPNLSKFLAMKVFLMVVSFLVIFLIFQYVASPWFFQETSIRAIFSLTMAAIFVAAGFGIADTFIADQEEE